MKIHRGNKLHFIDGCWHTYNSLVRMASERGVNLAKTTIRARIVEGITSIDEILAPSKRNNANSVNTKALKRDERKAEMAALLDRLGPPRRY